MKKVYRMENLDCANCARKMEDAIQKLDGVESVNINFLTQKMILTADEEKIQEIAEKAAKLCRRVEPDCRVIL